MHVGLFVTCFNDAMFPAVGKATVAVLERLGVEVDFPAEQTCCGQMHFNSGYRRQCAGLVAHFAEVFGGYETVVTPSASCASMVRHYHEVVRPGVAPPRVYELSEFLIDVLGVIDVGAVYPATVAFHPTCHSQRLLGIGDRPQRLLAAVAGLRLVELARPAECCGFGGTFSVKNPDTSVAMGNDKVDDVLGTFDQSRSAASHADRPGPVAAHVLACADTSCLMHIGGLLSRRGAGVRTAHLAEILASTA